MPESHTEQLITDLTGLQMKIQKRLSSALSLHGLGLSDYFVLDQLHAAPLQKLRRNELAERVGLTPSGITRLLNPLEKIGLVEKESNPRDARVSLVALSSAGKRLYTDARASYSAAATPLFASLTNEQRGQLSSLIKMLL